MDRLVLTRGEKWTDVSTALFLLTTQAVKVKLKYVHTALYSLCF